MSRMLKRAWANVSGLGSYVAKIRFMACAWKFESHGSRCGLESGVSIRGGTRIHLGDRVTVRKGVLIAGSGTLNIGSRTVVNQDVIIACRSSITIGEDCMIAPRAYILDVDHDFASRSIPISKQGYRTAPIVVGDDVWIGAYAVLLRGITIGRGAIVAAHAVVTKDVPEFAVVAGAPARVISMRPE